MKRPLLSALMALVIGVILYGCDDWNKPGGWTASELVELGRSTVFIGPENLPGASGVWVTETMVLTNRHVAEYIDRMMSVGESVDTVIVQDADGNEYEATEIYRSDTADFALFYVTTGHGRPAEIDCTLPQLRLGQEVVQIGYPRQQGPSYTQARVSIEGINSDAGNGPTFYVFPNGGAPGSSGSGVYDTEGRFRGLLWGGGVPQDRFGSHMFGLIVPLSALCAEEAFRIAVGAT